MIEIVRFTEASNLLGICSFSFLGLRKFVSLLEGSRFSGIEDCVSIEFSF